jgi:hypothetical protein
VGFEAFVIEMRPISAILRVGCGESVGVGTFEDEVMLPETSLQIANRGAGGTVRSVIGRSRAEPVEIAAIWMMVSSGRLV